MTTSRVLEAQLPAKEISRFINDAIRAQLRLTWKTLDEAYKAAAREPRRKAEPREQKATHTGGRPVYAERRVVLHYHGSSFVYCQLAGGPN